MSTNKGSEILSSALHKFTIIRNLCVHDSRLFNRLFEQRPTLKPRDKNKLATLADGTPDNLHLYGYIFLFKEFLNRDDFLEFKSQLMQLTQKYPFVDMKYYGFRSDWKTVL